MAELQPKEILTKPIKSQFDKVTTRQIRVKETKNLGPKQTITQNVPESKKEIKELLEVGFEYVCQKDTLIFLRKRK